MLIMFERIDGKPDRDASISEAFTVAQCARELGDMAGATTALRVIDALLHDRDPDAADVHAVLTYFG
jgi:hypothetical protein